MLTPKTSTIIKNIISDSIIYDRISVGLNRAINAFGMLKQQQFVENDFTPDHKYQGINIAIQIYQSYSGKKLNEYLIERLHNHFTDRLSKDDHTDAYSLSQEILNEWEVIVYTSSQKVPPNPTLYN